MDILSILGNEEHPAHLIQKDADPARYDAIAAKLCDKRIKLETELLDTTLSQEQKDSHLEALLTIKNDMAVFGITEIDYQAYIMRKQENNKDVTSHTETKSTHKPSKVMRAY